MLLLRLPLPLGICYTITMGGLPGAQAAHAPRPELCPGHRMPWGTARVEGGQGQSSWPPHTVYWILEPRGRDGMTGSGLGFRAVEAFLHWSCIASIHGFLPFLVGIGGSTLVVLFRCKAARIFRSRALMPRLTVLFTPRFSLPVSLRSSLSAVLCFPDACAVDSLSAVFQFLRVRRWSPLGAQH